MPDIAMCTNDECPKAKECFRHEAVPHPYWQSYMAFDLEKDNCFWPLDEATSEVKDVER